MLSSEDWKYVSMLRSWERLAIAAGIAVSRKYVSILLSCATGPFMKYASIKFGGNLRPLILYRVDFLSLKAICDQLSIFTKDHQGVLKNL